MGQPLWLLISSSYPFLSQSPGMLFPTSISPKLVDLPTLLDIEEEGCPLVVGPPSHLSQVVMGWMIPTIMVPSSAVETTLSASPRLTPRVSTSSANVAGGDVYRVIQQCPLTSPNMALIGAGADWGHVLAKKFMKAGVGKGRSIPLSKAMGPEECWRYVDISTSADIPPPITMKLDHQGPPVSYSKAASRPPQRETITQDMLHMCDVQMKAVACEKEKAATQATLDHIKWQEWDKQAAWRKEKECESRKAHQHEVQWRLAKEGAEQQGEYNRKWRASRACPDPITDPLGWCEYMWAKQDKYKAPEWAGDLWSSSPMDHQQLATCMVCSWGLVRAYQQTHQNVYICPPTPHVLEGI